MSNQSVSSVRAKRDEMPWYKVLWPEMQRVLGRSDLYNRYHELRTRLNQSVSSVRAKRDEKLAKARARFTTKPRNQPCAWCT